MTLKMEGKQNTPSVIARLMGIDKQPLRQTSHRPQKVLSEEYLRKTSSIGVLGKRSVYVDRINRSTARKQEKGSNNSEDLGFDRGNIWSICDEKENPKAGGTEFSFSRKRVMHELRRYCLTDSSSFVRKAHQAEHEHTGSRSRSRTKMEQSSLTLSKHLMKSSENTFDCTKVHQIPFRSSLIFGMEEENKNFEPWKTKNLKAGEVYDAGASIKRLYPKFGNHCLRRSHDINSKLVGPSRINRKYGLKNTYSEKLSRPNLSVIASRSPSFQTRPDDPMVDSSLVLEQAEMETPTKLQAAVSMTEDCFEKGSPSACFEKQLDRSEHLQSSYNSQSNASSDLHCCSAETEHMSTISDALIINLASTNWTAHKETVTLYEDGSSEVSPGTFSEKDGSSDVHEDLTLKMSSCETNRGGGWISGCQYDPDSAVILWDANQPTPDSVLEPPFKEDDSHVANLRGLAMKLQLLNSKSEETNSVCSVMDVSSDEDTENPTRELFQNSGRIWEMIRPEESIDFSYLVDVLDEADFSDASDWNLDSWYQRCNTEELAMNSSVFEVLEKKYGKQASWQKSERRLLFDRINSLLTTILHSLSYFNMGTEPLRRRFRSRLSRDEIEDELWSSLLVQGKEVSKDLGEKALAKDMKWLELEEDVVFICTEIEQILSRELVAELVRECL